MKHWSVISFLCAVLICTITGETVAQQASYSGTVRFETIDIYLDSAEPVAAWQFEFDEQNGLMAVVGVENGSSNAFSEAPYFDREAVQLGRADRIIVADYSLEPKESLPVGRIRLATIHVRLSGDDLPEFQLSLVAAASADGKPVRASISMDRPGVRND